VDESSAIGGGSGASGPLPADPPFVMILSSNQFDGSIVSLLQVGAAIPLDLSGVSSGTAISSATVLFLP
jgi:hypothetical protein